MKLVGGPHDGLDTDENFIERANGELEVRRLFTIQYASPHDNVYGEPVPHVESAFYSKDGLFLRRVCGNGDVHDGGWQ